MEPAAEPTGARRTAPLKLARWRMHVMTPFSIPPVPAMALGLLLLITPNLAAESQSEVNSPQSNPAWLLRMLESESESGSTLMGRILPPTPAWTTESDQEGAHLGMDVGAAGDVNGDGYDDVLVGVPDYDNGHENEGAALLYLGSIDGPSLSEDWVVEGDEYVAWGGRSVATAGDVNGDGYDDVIVGVPLHFPGGAVWVFHGSLAGPSLTPDWVVHSNQPDNSLFGFSVGTAGDVNGDGYDDVIVGAWLYDWDSPGGISQDGRAYVYHGSASGLSTAPAWITAGNQTAAYYGLSVGTAGDVNSDGYDDVIVSAYQYDNGEQDEGRAFVYHGSVSGLSMEPDWTFENNDVKACLGRSVGTAGDVNGDGYDDVIVGAAYNSCWNASSSPVGRAYTFHGSNSGLGSAPAWIAEMLQTGAIFGNVGTAGDVNGDGFDDVVVGAGRYDGDQVDEGVAFLYLGSAAGLSEEHVWAVEGDQASTEFGYSVGTAGDVNGDGLDDVLIGAYEYDNGETNEGRAFLYLGADEVTPAGWVPTDTPLMLDKRLGTSLRLTWGPSCLSADTDYEIYEGQLGNFASHAPHYCSTNGETGVNLTPGDGDMYYLVVPRNLSWEGSYGTTSDGTERPRGTSACLPQAVGACE
jgi:hypothetical protein